MEKECIRCALVFFHLDLSRIVSFTPLSPSTESSVDHEIKTPAGWKSVICVHAKLDECETGGNLAQAACLSLAVSLIFTGRSRKKDKVEHSVSF